MLGLKRFRGKCGSRFLNCFQSGGFIYKSFRKIEFRENIGVSLVYYLNLMNKRKLS